MESIIVLILVAALVVWGLITIPGSSWGQTVSETGETTKNGIRLYNAKQRKLHIDEYGEIKKSYTDEGLADGLAGIEIDSYVRSALNNATGATTGNTKPKLDD